MIAQAARCTVRLTHGKAKRPHSLLFIGARPPGHSRIVRPSRRKRGSINFALGLLAGFVAGVVVVTLLILVSDVTATTRDWVGLATFLVVGFLVFRGLDLKGRPKDQE